jgi:arylformamidase
MMNKNIIDISIPIEPGMVVYPNNPEVKFDSEKSKTSMQTTLSFGTHTGTHIDAPLHAVGVSNTKSIDELDLDIFYGPARVLDLSHVKDSVRIEHLEEYKVQEGERILLKTNNSLRGFENFYDDYVYLDGDAADYLTEKKIVLCGIDFLSIKQRGSSDHRPHTSLLGAGIAIIEAINLKDVEEGDYVVSALPLRLKGLDGSPCRAILIKKEN